MSTLIELLNYGQSYWLDNLTRKKISNGEIHRRVTKQGLRGITSNPSIFNKAISEGNSYDAQITKLVKQGKNPQQIYDALTIKDVQDACDILKPVYTASKGTDGFVSLEVSPYLAHDTQGTMAETRRLFKEAKRPNCFIKIPGTKEGVPAIEEMLYEGIPINITLLFSVERYVEVAEAYVRALERRAAEGRPVNNIISVASFFLSRIDVLADQLLGQHIIPFDSAGSKPGELPSYYLGKAGIASARLAYQRFKKIFSNPGWKALEAKGAQVQRPLWASTSTKNPNYNDLYYVETLIGPDTVNTLPDETIEALDDHGILRKNSIEENLDEAGQLFGKLKKLGIDIEFITQQLENEGVQKFMDAYNKLLTDLAGKRTNVLGKLFSTQEISFDAKGNLKSMYVSLDEKQTGKRLFAKDPYLWKEDADNVKSIANRMGWLTFLESFSEKADEIISFTKQVQKDGYKYAVLLGMGGSSLCSEVARQTFATGKGFLKLLVLDNTDPDAIHCIEKQVELRKTLFIVASKSGTTKESTSFFKYFYSQLEKEQKKNAGDHFISITDEGTPLVKISEEYKFRKVFVNPSDVGGRYSVLSDFGLLPMALMGIDIKAFLLNARQMEASCDPYLPASANPGVALGGFLGLAHNHGRDKITFVLSSSISSFGYWAEQLIAESTGKEGKGLIPVNGESLGNPDVYSNDRIFVHLFLNTDDNTLNNKKLLALEKAGHPVVRIGIPNKIALGGEYYRWEVATAIAGMVIGINPFNEPNVAESKQNTDGILQAWQKNGSFGEPEPSFEKGNISIYTGGKASSLSNKKNASAGTFINAFTSMAQRGDYIALLPYFLKTDKRTSILQDWRMQMRNEIKAATTLLHGPRYLHSTGQLHKGGPATGLYIILTGDEHEKLSIPGEKFGFATLHHAQALGDFKSLSDKGRRVIRVNLGENIVKGLYELWQLIKTKRRK
jgi:transaldolase/glucose-6-phosphate isomerase